MKIKLLVPKRPNLFLMSDEWFQFLGMNFIKAAFETRKTEESITCYYPERYLNIEQQAYLIKTLEDSGCKEFNAVTCSVQIIQNVHAKNIKIPKDEHLLDKKSKMVNKTYSYIDFDEDFWNE